jgi:hypothetical protein
LSGVQVDLTELSEQTDAMNDKLGELLAQAEEAMHEVQPAEDEEDEEEFAPPADEPRLSAVEEKRIERLFDQARQDKSKAYELKQELDRLELFADYEDRFLDLFKKGEPGSRTHEGDAA